MAAVDQERIAAVRRFNRFYTQHLGVLQEGWLDTPFSLTEARVLYELSRRERTTATALGHTLELDAGYLSRLLRSFEKRGLIRRRPSPDDGRQSFVSLTAKGHNAFRPLERHTLAQVGGSLAKLPAIDQRRLAAAMGMIENLLGAKPEGERAYSLRGPRHGDYGWIVSRHAELYAQEYGWGAPFEGLCAQIVADYVNKHDSNRKRCWIAELNGENVGSVMLVKDDQPRIARLRLLLVDPKARGLGIGRRLTDECVRFAHKAGYRGVTLWTHSVLTAARHIYEQAGFKLARSERHKSWGRPVVSEHWDLKF